MIEMHILTPHTWRSKGMCRLTDGGIMNRLNRLNMLNVLNILNIMKRLEVYRWLNNWHRMECRNVPMDNLWVVEMSCIRTNRMITLFIWAIWVIQWSIRVIQRSINVASLLLRLNYVPISASLIGDYIWGMDLIPFTNNTFGYFLHSDFLNAF